MPFEMFWYVEKRVLFVRIYGALAVEEIGVLSKEALERLDNATERFHILLDLTQIEKYPTNLGQVRKMMVRDKNPLLGWWVLIGTNSFIRFLMSALSQVANIHFRAVASLDEATKALGEIDESLREPLQQKLAERVGTIDNP
jgi:hypothetical protein